MSSQSEIGAQIHASNWHQNKPNPSAGKMFTPPAKHGWRLLRLPSHPKWPYAQTAICHQPTVRIAGSNAKKYFVRSLIWNLTQCRPQTLRCNSAAAAWSGKPRSVNACRDPVFRHLLFNLHNEMEAQTRQIEIVVTARKMPSNTPTLRAASQRHALPPERGCLLLQGAVLAHEFGLKPRRKQWWAQAQRLSIS